VDRYRRWDQSRTRALARALIRASSERLASGQTNPRRPRYGRRNDLGEQVKVELKDTHCLVTREPGDPTFRDGGWGSAESRFLHHVKRELVKQGHDVIKRRLQADDHLMGDETTQYIRERRHKFYIYDNKWAIRNLAEAFNADGQIALAVQRNDATGGK
jgi:hypothetical protein